MATVRPAVLSRKLDLSPEWLTRTIGSWPEPALLESAPGFGDSGRLEHLDGPTAARVFTSMGGVWSIREASGRVERGQGAPLDGLGRLLRAVLRADADLESQPEPDPDLDQPPFQGGMIGFFGYDLAPELERLPRKAPRHSRFPDIRMALYDTAVIVDHEAGSVLLQAYDLLGEGTSACRRRLRDWADQLLRSPREVMLTPSRLGPLRADSTAQEHIERVQRALEYIRAGDIFQVNLSQRFTARGRPQPLDLYTKLKALSPAPFSAFLAWDDLAVVSASPEWFYQTRGETIVTRPIKGTRPRGGTGEEDRRLVGELLSSGKDRAELTMIVDLERNDLGRVCRYGSIRVDEPLTVESFAQVHHLVATVSGELRPGVGPIDIVRAVFPGGSITGAPKIRAMEIIDELEPCRRGLYTGSIGYFSPGGASGFNIAIRTLLVDGDRVHYQVGGGIVSDSDPEAEYMETLHKGAGLRALIDGAGQGEEPVC